MRLGHSRARALGVRATLLLLALMSGLVALASPSAIADTIERVSVGAGGIQANDRSDCPAISADGRYVAFESYASNLVDGDANAAIDIFAYDRQTGTVERVSVTSEGSEGSGRSFRPSLSADGRWVMFDSEAALVPGDTNGVHVPDVYVHDRLTGATELVSVATDGTQASSSSDCYLDAISADGRYVAFMSDGTNLVDGDTNGYCDVFVHDRETGQTELIDVGTDGSVGEGGASGASISADGRYVAFESGSANLVPGATTGHNIFVRDRVSAQTEWISSSTTGGPPNGICGSARISADGRYVVFDSDASNLTPDHTNSLYDIFIHDRVTGVTELLYSGTGHSWSPSVSHDGRRVAFQSDVDGVQQAFLYDRALGELTCLTTGVGGNSGSAHVSSDGSLVSFDSRATNLVPDDTNGVGDVFLWQGEPAMFIGSPTSGRVPLAVVFTDLSVGNPTEWSWTFGDGGSSSEQNPTHEYLTPGSYDVSLTIAVGGGSDTAVRPAYVQVSPAVEAAFTASVTQGTVPLTVTFTDLSAGTITTWAWDFGDGDTSDVQNPSHSYTAAGLFDVSLTVANAYGSDTEAKPDYITAVPPAPAADFSAAPTSGAIPLIVQFTDQSYQGDPDSWAWDFGDGGTSAEQNPSHTYTTPGRYTVSLVAANAGGESTRTQTDFILATFTDVPVDHWALDPILACVAANIVQGYPGGSYHPGEVVNRAQMAVYVARALAHGDAFVPTGPETPHFNDVGTDHWAYDYVEYARFDGIVQGYLDGGYHPDEVVNRGQMAVYIARSVADPLGDPGVPEVPVGTTPAFPDVTADNDWAWCYKYVEYVAGFGIVQGYPNGAYKPEVEVTRDQMAVYVARAFALLL